MKKIKLKAAYISIDLLTHSMSLAGSAIHSDIRQSKVSEGRRAGSSAFRKP
jgi:hypothetical protein